MERANKPSALPMSPSLPQPLINITGSVITASLPTGESVTVNLFGATVTSWTLADGEEQLFLSSAAKLDGSKAIRGGIPIVFPVFGPPPPNHVTSSLPQHGFARSTHWEFLGKSSSESFGTSDKTHADDSVKLDFGLSPSMLAPDVKKAWPLDFALVYSVTLGRTSLETGLHVQNKSEKSAIEFQALFHNYLAIKDISQTIITGLTQKPYIDKVLSATHHTETAASLRLTSETDRVYSSLDPSAPITVASSSSTPLFSLTRDGLPDCTVWNQWEEKAKAMADFAPKDAWRRYVCVEPGAVSGWVRLEAGDAWEGTQIIKKG